MKVTLILDPLLELGDMSARKISRLTPRQALGV